MEGFKQSTNQESQEDPYVSLKNELLSGQISLEQMRDKLVRMDQETPSHDAAFSNLKFLKNPEILNAANSSPEALDGYKRLLSFTEFHIGQWLASENNDECINHFQEALSMSSDEGWSAYIQGTILYLQGDEISEDLILKASNEKNMQVLRNLKKGLQQRRKPSYKDDYSSLGA